MRNIVAGLFISLDGVVESPNQWGFRYMDAELSKAIFAGVAQSDAVLMGGRTYQEFAQLWPGHGDEVPMVAFLNKSHIYVVSSTLDRLTWQPASLINGNLVEELTRLKQQPGMSIIVPGSPTLVRALIQLGLLDVLSLSICPVLVSSGMRLFKDNSSLLALKLIHSTILGTGVIIATYAPLRNGKAGSQKPISFPQASVRN